MSVFKITRRQLLIGAAGAAAVAGSGGLWLGMRKLRGLRYRRSVDRPDAFSPSAFLSVTSDGKVTVWLTKSEMGQGVSTTLPMMIAEELDAAWESIRVEFALCGAQVDYGSQRTMGSGSTSSMWTELRRAGAVAREMLLKAGADHLDASAAECVTSEGFVQHSASGRRVAYGEIAERAQRRWAPVRPDLKRPDQFVLLGTPKPRLDLGEKVTGKAVFGLDVRVPDQRFAVIARPPRIGSSVISFDPAAALAVAGVERVVQVSSGVAVVAATTHAALLGRQALHVDWTSATGGESTEALGQQLREAADQPGGVAKASGDWTSEDADVVATYELPFVAHATMEPMNCTAHVHDGLCEIWAPTQDPEGARLIGAEVTAFAPNRVTVHKTHLGGGFGRRAGHDFVRDAVEVAMQVPQPVQVVWSREDDMRHSAYRPASAHHLRGKVDSQGALTAWLHRVATPVPAALPAGEVSSGALRGILDAPYAVARHRVEWNGVLSSVPMTIWRSIEYSYNVFAMESFLDELATSARQDPIDFRLKLLGGQPRLASCLERVAELSQWAHAKEAGRHLGVACCACFGSFVAQVVEVATANASRDVEPTDGKSGESADSATDTSKRPAESDALMPNAASKDWRVTKVWCVADCGFVVNPNIVAAQLEGGIVFGMTAATYGRISIRDGAVAEGNFDSYPLLRVHEAPDIHVDLIESDSHPSGVGELAVPAIAPALANALFAATRQRQRSLPTALESLG